MSLAFIRQIYRVPARRGVRVRVLEGEGVITQADGARLRVRLDGEKRAIICHPTWIIEYLPGEGQA